MFLAQGRLIDGPLVTDAKAVPTVVFTTKFANSSTLALWKRSGVQVETVPADDDGRVDIAEVLLRLGKRGILQVLVDGGPTLQAAMMVQVPHAIRKYECIFFACKLLTYMRMSHTTSSDLSHSSKYPAGMYVGF